jgi:hypothetical protein
MGHLQTPATTAQQALNGLERLPDSPMPPAIRRAKSIISFIERSGSPQPFVFPTEIRGVQFEWHGGKRELDVEVLPEGDRIAYVTFIEGDPHTEGEIGKNIEEDLRRLLAWLV